MSLRILIVQGHPDHTGHHFCHALADAYAKGAAAGGREVRRIDVAALGLPYLTSEAEWSKGEPPLAVVAAQSDIEWASHLVIIYPLWLGGMPAVLKGFLEHVARPGFAFSGAGLGKGRLGGRSAHIIITMGMPALVFRWWFGAHSVKSLEQNILNFVGISPVRQTLIGSVGNLDETKRRAWLSDVEMLGYDGR